jgi:hypothetical protein
LNRLVPNGMPGGVRGRRNFPLLDCRIKSIFVGCRSPPSVLVFIKKIKTEVWKMKRINLRDYYPSYTSDFFLEVADEIAFVDVK